MRGKLLVFEPYAPTPRVYEYHDKPIKLQDLNAAVGGYIEVVPYFDSLPVDGGRVPCRAFCNEHGKLNGGSPWNDVANALWRDALAYQNLGPIDDYLVGSIAVVVGDEAFMEAL
jgi:hypothetical protein